MVSSALVGASTSSLPISRRVAATGEIGSRPIASKVGPINYEGFLLLTFLSLLGVLLVSSLSQLHSPSHRLLLRSRARESIGKAQGRELVLREYHSSCRYLQTCHS